MISLQRILPGLAGCLLAALVAAGAEARAESRAGETLNPIQARNQVVEMISPLPTREMQLDRLIATGYLSPDIHPAVRDAAREVAMDFNPRLFVERVAIVYDRLTPPNLLAMLRAFDRHFPNMGGHSYELNALVTAGAASPDGEVNRVAEDLCARYRVYECYFNLRRRANRSKGEDRIRAIETLGRLADPRAGIFLPTLIDSKDRAVREAVYTALGRLGRPGTLTLKERLSHPDPEIRMLALKNLMPLAVVDDLPALYAFLEANPKLAAPIKEEMFALIARLEVIRDRGVETPRD